jgi:hypothetical protein
VPKTREPALILAVISAALSLIVTFNIGLTSDQAGLWVAVITAVFALATALATRPVAPAVFTGLVTAVGALLMGYHFHVDPAVLAQVNGLVLAVLTLVTRHQVTPLTKADVNLAA